MLRLTIKNTHGQQMAIHGFAKYIDDDNYIVFYMNDYEKPIIVEVSKIIEIVPVT